MKAADGITGCRFLRDKAKSDEEAGGSSDPPAFSVLLRGCEDALNRQPFNQPPACIVSKNGTASIAGVWYAEAIVREKRR